MKPLTLALSLLLASCAGSVTEGEAIPGYPDFVYRIGDCNGPWSPEDVSLGVWTFLSSWDGHYGFNDAVDYSIAHLHLHCMPEDWHSDAWNMEVAGLTGVAETAVALKAKATGRCRTLPKSAFLHELVHTALGACCGNSDSDHADGTKYGDTWTTETDDFLYDTTLKLQYYLRQEGDFSPDEDGVCFDGSDRLK